MKKFISLLLVLMLLLACLPGAVLAAEVGEEDGLEAVLNCEGMTIPVTFRESDFFRSAYE